MTSDERYAQLVKRHRDEELHAWRLFRFELERRWDLLYPGFREHEYLNAVEETEPSGRQAKPGERFLKEHFNSQKRGWFQDNTLAEVDGLVFRARQRVRSRYHCSVTLAPSPGFSASTDRPRMNSWQLYLTPPALAGGIRIASALGYAVTLSTPRAGASERSFHFLAMPRVLSFGGTSYVLYKWLEERPATPVVESPDLTVQLVDYPAFCVRVHGESRQVAAIVWSLASEYASLISFNLVITPGTDIEHASVFFFPRPLRPALEGPERFSGKWTFGAFEMGGFFVQEDGDDYRRLTYEGLSSFLREVSVCKREEERRRVTELLSRVPNAEDIAKKVEAYCHRAG